MMDKSQKQRQEYCRVGKESSPNLVLTSIWIFAGLGMFGSIFSTILDEVWLDDDFTVGNGSKYEASRSKRFLYMTSDRRLNFPPRTALDILLTLGLPGVNPLPIGLSSQTAISIPFSMDFDILGLTSEENTFGHIPFMNQMLTWMEPIGDFMNMFLPNPDDENHLTRQGGGHRAIIYQVIEDALGALGIDGKSCLLRTICEVHQTPIFGHGIFGEFLELLLSVSSSNSDLRLLADYLKAEEDGKNSEDCYSYSEKCPLSLFAPLSRSDKEHEAEIWNDFIIKEGKESKNKTKYYKPTKKKSYALKKEHYIAKKHKKLMTSLSRDKRFIFFGPAGRIRLPIGTIFNIKPQLKFPFMGNLPESYHSHFDVGIPFRVIFDDLGLTSVLNPFMTFPFLSNLFRKKRDSWTTLPGVNYSGGDRELIFAILEHALDSWTVDGRSCILRAICETHLQPLKNYGFLGEVLTLFLSPSRSPHADLRLKQYVTAEYYGKDSKSCKRYFEKCPISIFVSTEELSARESMLCRRQATDLDEEDK